MYIALLLFQQMYINNGPLSIDLPLRQGKPPVQVPTATFATNSSHVPMQGEGNRIKGKLPYKELKGTGPVSKQAQEAWEYKRSRSSSVIDDVFAGQLQSTLQCPKCHCCSHSFDDFLDLSLQLPPRPAAADGASRPLTVQVNQLTCIHRSWLLYCLVCLWDCGKLYL